MATRDERFRAQLRATFRVEAREHLQAIGSGLVELEKAPAAGERRRIVESIFRAAHSLKGAARAVNFTAIESACQSLEDIFASWKRQESTPSLADLDRAHKRVDEIGAALSAGERGAESAMPETPAVPRLEPEPAVATPVPVSAAEISSADTVRIAVAKLDAQLLRAEEMLAVKLAAAQRAGELRELAGPLEAWRREWAAIEPEVRALRRRLDRSIAEPWPATRAAGLLHFLDRNLEYVASLENRIAALARAAEQDRRGVGRLVDDLLEGSKKLLLLPFGTITGVLPKLVRDLCRDQGKEAELTIRGEDVEIDKRILDEMKDPLVHLLRNCVDHGIERAGERARLGKPPRATITLSVRQVNGSKVEIAVSDDGAGVDIEKVRKLAVARGLIPEEEARRLDQSEALRLVFLSDVSTSPAVTHLSGRGLGLAIVKEKTERLGGAVAIESSRNMGTTIRITLPVMLATFRGIVVEAAGAVFVVPTLQVERVARVRPSDIRTVEGRETISLAGRAVAFARLADVLGIAHPATGPEPDTATPVVVLGSGEQRVAFAVDAVRDELEVLVKPLGKLLVRVRNISGATILGSGRVVPILNVADLLKSARKPGVRQPAALAAGPAEAEAKTILVVEDSITSRMLLKGILEAAGYRVRTAVDGVDALASLRTEPFDLIVSDVEMPRMNGFELTQKIRADARLAELPVVLVTALATREDRERGIEAGANAYLVKSDFDQSDLLETIRRLI